MATATTHDPNQIGPELREQLASNERHLAFLLGAGTSMSVGLPGIDALTSAVEKKLASPHQKRFADIKTALVGKPNVEDVLNRVRLMRELIDMNTDKRLEGLEESDVQELDAEICRAICTIVQSEPPGGLDPHIQLAKWLYAQHLNRQFPIEIFTTNYDLLVEKAMEEIGLPFFDGFVGSVAPFFTAGSIEIDNPSAEDSMRPPRAWTRLWKLHGSVSWRLRTIVKGSQTRIVRTADPTDLVGQLMIFPSRDKYTDSRKLPFITYQDRLRKFLSSGRALLFVAGYSFSDQHINEIIFEALRVNSRLAVTALLFDDQPAVLARAQDYRNFAVYTPTQACIGGVLGS